MNLFNPKGFLTVGGAVLLLIGVLGFLGILIGPTPAQSLFGAAWYFDPAENIAHTFLGIVALLAAFLLTDAMYQKWLVAAVGVLGIVVGLYSLMGPITAGVNLLGAQLQNPADTLLHLVVGAWGLYCAFGPGGKKKK